jgi:hypothetical protein
MTNTQIETVLEEKLSSPRAVTIHFRSRNPIIGLFIKTKDYDELKSKNLWRIVGESKLSEFGTTKDQNLAKIFNGVDMTKIVIK